MTGSPSAVKSSITRASPVGPTYAIPVWTPAPIGIGSPRRRGRDPSRRARLVTDRTRPAADARQRSCELLVGAFDALGSMPQALIRSGRMERKRDMDRLPTVGVGRVVHHRSEHRMAQCHPISTVDEHLGREGAVERARITRQRCEHRVERRAIDRRSEGHHLDRGDHVGPELCKTRPNRIHDDPPKRRERLGIEGSPIDERAPIAASRTARSAS